MSPVLTNDLISNEAAVNFISETLGIEDVELKLETNKLSLLNEIIRAHHQYIPCHNLSILAADEQERCVPTLQKCIDDCLQGIGGKSDTLNRFFVCILQALGFNAYVVSGSSPRYKLEDCNVIIIVRDIEESGDKYYVDVGFILPTFVAIPIHTLEDGQSDFYDFASYSFRLTRRSDKYIRSYKKNTMLWGPAADDSDEWLKLVDFENIHRDDSFFHQSLMSDYTDNKTIETVAGTIYPPGKAVIFLDQTVKIWDEETNNIEHTNFDSMEETIEKVTELFPMIPLETIQNGFNAWLKSQN